MNTLDTLAALIFGFGIGLIISSMFFAVQIRLDKKKKRGHLRLINLDTERNKRGK